jgi:hypothetical protein
MKELNSIQTELKFKKLLTDLKNEKFYSPIIKIIYNFKDQNTVVEMFDHYVGIKEFNRSTKKLEYVALGKLTGESSRGQPQFDIVDLRIIEDTTEFVEFGEIFSRHIVENDIPIYDRLGEFAMDEVLDHISYTWILAREKTANMVH